MITETDQIPNYEKIWHEISLAYYKQDLDCIDIDDERFRKFYNTANFDYLVGGVVYFIHMKETPYYKIGITHSLNGFHNRMKNFKTGIPFNIDVITMIELEMGVSESAGFIEKFLHNHFKHKKKNREWFEFTHDEVLAIYSFMAWDLDIFDYKSNSKVEDLMGSIEDPMY